MTEKEVMIDLYVELGIAYQKAATMLAQSSDTPRTEVSHVSNTVNNAIDKVDTTKTPTNGTGHGLADMSAAEAMALVTGAETAEELISIGSEEKARGSKARKGVMKTVQAKLDKLKNPPAQADAVEKGKSFTSTTPATAPADVKLFTAHFGALTEDQKNAYFNGQINSLGESLGTSSEVNSDDSFEDLGLDAPAELSQDDLRDKLKAYAKKNGPEKAYEILAHFGVKKIAQLDPAKYGDVAAELA